MWKKCSTTPVFVHNISDIYIFTSERERVSNKNVYSNDKRRYAASLQYNNNSK